jgi:hypothetical protein
LDLEKQGTSSTKAYSPVVSMISTGFASGGGVRGRLFVPVRDRLVGVVAVVGVRVQPATHWRSPR